jgi:hypothetical protein
MSYIVILMSFTVIFPSIGYDESNSIKKQQHDIRELKQATFLSTTFFGLKTVFVSVCGNFQHI